MNIPMWIIFGLVNGIVLYWIKPDRSVGGYFGAALLGGGGAVLGGGVALLLYETLRTMNIMLFVLLLMTVSALFLIISNMIMHRKQWS